MDELKKLLESLELDVSDELIEKLQGVIDAAIAEKLTEGESAAEEARELLVEAKNELIALRAENVELKGKVDDFESSLEEAVQNFLTENTDKFVAADEFDRMKTAFENIHSAFETNGFVLNENTELEKLRTSTAALIDRHDETLTQLAEANKALDELKREKIIAKAVEGLTEMEAEKVIAISDAITFDDLDELSEGLTLIVERISSKGTDESEGEPLNEAEGEPITTEKVPDEKRASYLAELNRFANASK